MVVCNENGGTQCSVQGAPPGDEQCDGLDNDCDTLVDDDDAAATQARRDSTAEWDLEALGEPELARTTTPLV